MFFIAAIASFEGFHRFSLRFCEREKRFNFFLFYKDLYFENLVIEEYYFIWDKVKTVHLRNASTVTMPRSSPNIYIVLCFCIPEIVEGNLS